MLQRSHATGTATVFSHDRRRFALPDRVVRRIPDWVTAGRVHARRTRPLPVAARLVQAGDAVVTAGVQSGVSRV